MIRLVAAAALAACAASALGQDSKTDPRFPYRTEFANAHLPWWQPRPLEFPPPHSERRIIGELVSVDFIHRRGQFRTSTGGELVDFVLPPYGNVFHLNSEADLRDVPLGGEYSFLLHQDADGGFTRLASLRDRFTADASEGCTYRIDELRLGEGKLLATRRSVSNTEAGAVRIQVLVLWSSMPDERLLQLAGRGKLHTPDALRAEVRRMLADPKAAAFARSFPYQWLQLRKVGMFAPDKVAFPDYDEYLEKSLIAETLAFFGEVLERNGDIREFLDSDWTMLNERLAAHYGIAEVKGEAMRRVSLAPGDHRGGLLTQGSILGLTSDGQRHRPVHRGVWVLESIIGRPPPPPPANVPALNTPSKGMQKMTLRERLQLHRSEPTCMGCHQRIDPLGLAFDNYDAVGRWRTVETVREGTGADPRLDPSGELIDGRRFADAAGLKRLLLEDADRFATAFAEKLATYALRRGMTFADRTELTRIAAQSKADGYKLVALLECLVESDLFLRR